MTSRSLIYLIAGMGLMIMSFRDEITTDSYSGYAYNQGTNDLIYTEEFTDRFVNGKQVETLTNYFDPSHKKIAQRNLDFINSKYAPNFRIEDLRTGYMEGAELVGSKVKLFYKKNFDAATEEKIIDVPAPVVIDGGFNQFIKANWNDLVEGRNIVFHFVVPYRLDYYTLKASKVEMKGKQMKIKVEPDKALLRLLAPPILITYNSDTRRIMSYEGKSNIADKNGNNFFTKLRYPGKGP